MSGKTLLWEGFISDATKHKLLPLQMLDMIMPKKRNVISLQDLRRCRMTPIFFDTFFNLEKYLDHEQRDPFASQRDVDEDGNEVN